MRQNKFHVQYDANLDGIALVAELLAECLKLGMSIDRALQLVRPYASEDINDFFSKYEDMKKEKILKDNLKVKEYSVLMSVINIAENVGASSKKMFLSQARRIRANRQYALERSIEKLGVKIVLPLGLCVLPAFFALGVIPVIISLAAQTF